MLADRTLAQETHSRVRQKFFSDEISSNCINWTDPSAGVDPPVHEFLRRPPLKRILMR